VSDQRQFLDVIDRDVAQARFEAALDMRPVGIETVAVSAALGRVLAADIAARVDVPSFDRSNVDGFALRAVDTFGATELTPKSVRLLEGSLEAGSAPQIEVGSGQAVGIATGGMIPRGADAVSMIEHADVHEGVVFIRRAVTPGSGVSFAGTDIATGETVLRAGTLLTSRETGVLAALGEATVDVWRRPRVAVISTGNELISPGEPMRPAQVYDSNSRILADALVELGAEPREFGIVRDDTEALREMLRRAMAETDLVLLSGGTSKGEGDLCYRVVSELKNPGIVAHGVALKPGKPLCLAAHEGKGVVILPGFPTSAIFTFHEFVAPVVRRLAGGRPEVGEVVQATMAVKSNSEIGRTEYLLVGLVRTESGLSAFPMGKGSGSVTAFSRADGFVTIGRHTEIVEAGQSVDVRLIGRDHEPADFVVIGSHCVGLDYLLSQLERQGVRTKLLTVGSSAGLAAVKRGECDIAGIHLLDVATGRYNRPFLSEGLELIEGYGRRQGIVFRKGDARFEGRTPGEIAALARDDATCVMVNRNQGSGTRILIDGLLEGASQGGAAVRPGDSVVRPSGYAVQPSNHNAVAAAVAQSRADWGVAVEWVARAAGLGFTPLREEQYDFAVATKRKNRPAVRAFVALLADAEVRHKLTELGMRLDASPRSSS
jgi:putative molybdopterin biosynthesis protein